MRLYGWRIKSFLYFHCTDLAAIQRFYSDHLGLDEVHYSFEDGTVGYRVGTLQVTFALHTEAELVGGWASQLGWLGGDRPTPSWGVELTGDRFRRAVNSTRVALAPVFFEEPKWVGYWSFPVRDPMGNTVEITSSDESSWRS